MTYFPVVNAVTGQEFGGSPTFLLACALRNQAMVETGVKHYVTPPITDRGIRK